MTEVQEHLRRAKARAFFAAVRAKNLHNKQSVASGGTPSPPQEYPMQLTNALIRLGATARDKTDAIRQVAALLAENGKDWRADVDRCLKQL